MHDPYSQVLFLQSFGCVGILRLSTEPELKCEGKISVLGTGYSITQYKVAQSLNIITMMIQVNIFNKSATLFIQPALRALGLLLADSALTMGWGKTFWHVGRVFFYENGRNTDTKRAKNGPLTKLGLYGKRQIFVPKTKFTGPKKAHFLVLTMF